MSVESYPITNALFLDHLKREMEQYFSQGVVGAAAFTISIHMSPANPDYQLIRDQYCGRIPMTTEELLKRLFSPLLSDRLHGCNVHLEMVQYMSDDITSGFIQIHPLRQSVGQYEMVVYANSVAEDSIVETLLLPDKSTIVVGNFDPFRKNPIDVELGHGPRAENYPLIQQGVRLNEIVSRLAFVLFPQTTGSWLCQARKQGEYMWIQDPDQTRAFFPLSFPNRTVRFTLNEFIVLVQDFERHDNRLYCEIRPRNPKEAS